MSINNINFKTNIFTQDNKEVSGIKQVDGYDVFEINGASQWPIAVKDHTDEPALMNRPLLAFSGKNLFSFEDMFYESWAPQEDNPDLTQYGYRLTDNALWFIVVEDVSFGLSGTMPAKGLRGRTMTFHCEIPNGGWIVEDWDGSAYISITAELENGSQQVIMYANLYTTDYEGLSSSFEEVVNTTFTIPNETCLLRFEFATQHPDALHYHWQGEITNVSLELSEEFSGFEKPIVARFYYNGITDGHWSTWRAGQPYNLLWIPLGLPCTVSYMNADSVFSEPLNTYCKQPFADIKSLQSRVSDIEFYLFQLFN